LSSSVSPPSSLQSNEATATRPSCFEPENQHAIKSLPSVTPLSKENRDRTREDWNALYELPKLETPPAAEMKPIETFVFNAIFSQEKREPGDDAKPDPSHIQGYRAIIASLKRPSDPPMLRKVFIALRTAGHGSVLNKLALGANHAQLVHLIIRFISTRPPHRFEEIASGNPEELLKVYDDHSICDAHFQLLLAMVSAKSIHVVPILTAIWKLLSRFGPIEDDALTNRVHAMLYHVMRLVPRSTSEMFPIIAARFPFWRWDKDVMVWYVKQCFRVVDYLPEIRQRILELVIDRCLEIDVNIFIKDNGDVTIDEEEQGKMDEPGEVPDEINSGTVQMEGEIKKQDDVDILSDKLDALLEVLFGHIRSRCSGSVDTARQTFYELVPIFESSILTTHKSKFVQYCMFLCCGLEAQAVANSAYHRGSSNPKTGLPLILSQDQSTSVHEDAVEEAIVNREFASKLLDIIVDPYRANTTRQSGACYLASFISRASFVGPDTVCESVSTLMRWAEAYIQSLGKHAVRAADVRTQSQFHSLFYTVCQAAFYIMGFRGSEAVRYYRKALAHKEAMGTVEMDTGDDQTESPFPDLESIDLSSERWTFLCGHELQPLRFCLESVRSEFLHVAHFFNLIEGKTLDKLVADAKRLSTGRVNKKAASLISTAATLQSRRQTGGVGGLGRGSNPLKSFFPFDPLLLRQSHEFIEPLYRYWQGPVEEDDVLVIDELGVGEGEPTFEMDETMNALTGAANEEDEDSDEDEDDDEDDSDDDDDDDDEDDDDEKPATAVKHEDEFIFCTPNANQHKLLQQKAWTETLKRPRSYSMEYGSW